jgi:cytochrome c peroxidase
MIRRLGITKPINRGSGNGTVLAFLLLFVGMRAAAQERKESPAEPFRLSPMLGIDEFVPTPDDNPLSRGRVNLGRELFFSKLLSRDRSISCASCHQPAHAFADTLARSAGLKGRAGRRNAPALLNRAFGTSFFWDGRANTLESQVLQPIRDTSEMDLPIGELVIRLRRDPSFSRDFTAEFEDGVNATNLARALASFVRTIRTGDAPFDRFRAGDTSALSPDARRGMALFSAKANCSACHSSSNFTDEQFHNTGAGAETGDVGRFSVTLRERDRGAFKTPTLRDIARTSPYMHDGSLHTLEDVVDFYDRGGRPNPSLDREIHPLGLSADEKHDLVAFLRALTGTERAGLPLP